jgi:hypothetical protein
MLVGIEAVGSGTISGMNLVCDGSTWVIIAMNVQRPFQRKSFLIG